MLGFILSNCLGIISQVALSVSQVRTLEFHRVGTWLELIFLITCAIYNVIDFSLLHLNCVLELHTSVHVWQQERVDVLLDDIWDLLLVSPFESQQVEESLHLYN